MLRMEPNELRLFLFDMAGTTVRDDGVVLGAFHSVAADADCDVDSEWLRERMGWHKQRVFAELLAMRDRDPALAPQLAASFAEQIATGFAATPPRPLDGALESFAALRDAGCKVGFTTGFEKATADLILDALGWEPDVRVASDEVAHGRPAPDLILEGMRRCGVDDPAAVGAAGDTPSDLEAATAAGCRVVVGVGHGTHTLDELAAAPHTALLDDLTGLMDAIRAGD